MTYIETNFISLATLTILLITSLSWFVFKTLKEGRKALEETNKNEKYQWRVLKYISVLTEIFIAKIYRFKYTYIYSK